MQGLKQQGRAIKWPWRINFFFTNRAKIRAAYFQALQRSLVSPTWNIILSSYQKFGGWP
ncbi:heat shock factor protein 1 isoform X5 [Acetobacter orientalis]|uniref:Heat shock factor protein 1 isoform X5 n=1 Tax=Acetobacter orientalis TaxID=146474 RepID=A0A2Z5ZIC5_9PROT|nr:heat shock factor protein 1 isoform X5 [Acetobacter orientalis]